MKSWQGRTSEAGSYSAPLLPVGTYDISFTASGFRKVEISGYVLSVDERARLDQVLELGQVNESITVVGGSIAHLEAETSSLGIVVNPADLQDLPMVNRDIMNLLNLSAGVSGAAIQRPSMTNRFRSTGAGNAG